MRVLIVGAGVIGSFNVARLVEAGQDVTLQGTPTRGSARTWVVLESFRSGRRMATQIPLVERLGPALCALW